MSTMKWSFKRPFQPSISSYFGRARDTESLATAPHTAVLSPALPAAFQSSLLNIGMRVRKSVPEGYPSRPKTFCGPSTSYTDTSFQSDNSSNHSRSASTGFSGLLPYCGIFEVGGHEMQHVPPEDELPPLHFDHHGWSLPSSQESYDFTMSTDSMTTSISIPYVGNNKRRREDADEEDLDLDSQPVSPRSRPISHTRMPNLDQIRPIALPKTRRNLRQTPETEESEMLDVGDFGEAEFFRPDEWGRDWMHFDWM